MSEIALLSKETIDKIAAGEVIERPSSVVKELVENAIDAGATAITVEIREGGTRLIRITDNGSGIEKESIPLAFLRHSTSKIRSAEDLSTVASLGFRGEALSSIAAVSRVELITKTYDQLTGIRYVIEGGKELACEEIGAPDGSTFLVKDLFYNTPARKKFLKTPQTEGNYVASLVEKLALSHPDISFKFINNNQTKLHTAGNGSQKDLIYHIFGREIASSVLKIDRSCEWFRVSGFIGKPVVTRGNRNYENYFINQRYVKSNVIARAIEEAYKGFIMQHQYPFTVLYFEFAAERLDVNVHPTKMEIRFDHESEIYEKLCGAVRETLSHKDLIPQVPLEKQEDQKPEYKKSIPEPFEKRRLNEIRNAVAADSPYSMQYKRSELPAAKSRISEDTQVYKAGIREHGNITQKHGDVIQKHEDLLQKHEDMTLGEIDAQFLSDEAKSSHRIIGQLFDTYWLIEYREQLYIIDQHAAHEKVLYEEMMNKLNEKEFTSQAVSPPILISLDPQESETLAAYLPQFERLGYCVEHFGGKEYTITAVPDNLFHTDMKELFVEMLDDLSGLTSGKDTPQIVLEKAASMSCKAAVKGNQRMSAAEADALIARLLSLENPYNCPHGRPTIISMSKYEIEKKFKRII